MPDQADQNRTVPLPPNQLPRIAADPDGPKFGPPSQPGEVGTLGPYRVLKELGKGGMGAVYLALDPRLDRRLALKVMLPKFAADRDARERFLREAKAAAKVEHINVVTVYEADERDGVPYIAMQFLQGYPLDQFLKTKGVPPLPHAIRIGREAALGLAAAHALGVIHRDIKPANLWLEVPNGRVKVLDFGLAKPVDAVDELTASGAVMGTPAYMAPEQARGKKVDARADLWSLGVVLYRLCTGKPPFDGPTAMAVVMALGNDDPTPVRELNPQVPEALTELIHQLLAKKPDERPASAAEVASRLYAVLGQVLAPPPNVVQAIPYQPAASMQITAPNVFADLDDEPTDADATVAEPAPRAKGGKGVPLAAAGVALLAVAVVAAVASQMGKKDRPSAQSTDPPPVFAPGPKATPPKVTPAKDRDREVAEWVIGSGGWVYVEGIGKEVSSAADLPQGPFVLTGINWQDPKVSDDDLARFEGLTGLGALGLNGATVTNDGLRHLKDLPVLGSLNLTNCTGITDAGLVHLRECKALFGITLSGTGVTDEGLKRIKEFKRVAYLHLCNTKVTDAGLAHLGELTELANLNLDGTKVTDAGLAHLKKLDKLVQLSLGATGVTGEGMAHLKGLTALKSLGLRESKVSDAGLEQLKGLPALVYLILVATPVTDAGLKHLAEFPALTAIELDGTPISDAGLAYLKGCKKLDNLSLTRTAITDEGLKHLAALPGLNILSVNETRVTAKGLEAFRAAVPECTLQYDAALAPNLPITNRSAAEWVFERGGNVTIDGANKVLRAVDLPKGPFALTGVDLTYRDVGDNLSGLKGLKRLASLSLSESNATDRALASLGELPALVSLNMFACTRVTDAGLAHVKGFRGLNTLSLHNTGVTDVGMEHLAGLTTLSNLNLVGTKVTDAGLVHLKGLTDLAYLGLSGPKVTDAGLAHLKGLTKLIQLGVGATDVTDAGLVHLKALAALKSLGLNGAKVTDAGLAHLAELPALAELHLQSTAITDEGLKRLTAITGLTSLSLAGTKVTADGVAKFRKALPNCKVEWTEPKK